VRTYPDGGEDVSEVARRDYAVPVLVQRCSPPPAQKEKSDLTVMARARNQARGG
jgi:hypothetical protein